MLVEVRETLLQALLHGSDDRDLLGWDGGGGSVEDTYLIDVKTENE